GRGSAEHVNPQVLEKSGHHFATRNRTRRRPRQWRGPAGRQPGAGQDDARMRFDRRCPVDRRRNQVL
ncbi:MAG: hypothetical protein, partial [Olavius algarvensis Gamma 3 endosymbiont]